MRKRQLGIYSPEGWAYQGQKSELRQIGKTPLFYDIIKGVFRKQGETFMEEKIFVQMTEKALFDFMLFHTYSKFAGFLSNVLGMAVAFIGIILTIMNKATIGQLVLYLVAAAIFVSFTPIQLKMRAKKQMQTKCGI